MGKTAYFHAKIVLGLLSVFFLSACEKKEGTSVTFKFPDGNHIGAAKVQSASVNDSGWGAADPATVADLNCYAVFVGGNKDGKSCVSGTGTSFQTITFNKLKGFVTSGSSVQIEDVPLGTDRFYIIAARSIDGTCDIMSDNGNLNQNRYSNPLLVGSAQQEIKSGDNSVDINISLATDLDTQKLKTCNFFGENVTPNTISFQGPINNYSSPSKLGTNTCNMVYAAIRADNDHDGFVSVPFTMNLSTTPASALQIYSDPTCTTALPTTAGTAAIDFLPGENFKPFYTKGTTFGVGTLSVSAPISSVGTLANNFLFQVSGASSVQSFTFYRDHNAQAVGGCQEYPFYAMDYNGYSANIGTVTPVMYDIAGTDRTSLLNSGGSTGLSRFQNSCDTGATLITGSQNYSSSSFASLYFSLGNNWADMLVGVSTGSFGIFAGSAVNVNPVMNSIQLQGNPAPFVSDCSPIQMSGLTATNGTVDFSGTDSWGNPQTAKVNFYNMNNSNPANIYLDSSCGIPDGSSITTLSSATQITNKYVTYGTIAAYQFRAWAGPYAKNNEKIITINPKWDPSLLKGTMGSGALLIWGRSQEAEGGSVWNSRGTFLVNFPYSHYSLQNITGISGSPTTNSPDSELGGTYKSVSFNGTSSQNLQGGNFSSANFYTAALVKLNNLNDGDVIGMDDTSASLYLSMFISSGTLNVNSVPIGTTGVNVGGWNVFRVKVDNGSVAAAINNNNWINAGTTSGTFGSFFLGSGGGSPSFNGKIGEVMVMDGVPNTNDDTKIYNYFRTKFSNLGLPAIASP